MTQRTLGLNEYLKHQKGAYEAFHSLARYDQARLMGFHEAKWFDKNGVLLREDIVPNLITTAGKNLILTSGLGTCYINLIVENRHVGDCQTYGTNVVSS